MGRQHYSSMDIALLTDPTGWCPWNTDSFSPRQPNGASQTEPKQGRPSVFAQQEADQCNYDSTTGSSPKRVNSQNRGGSVGSQLTSSNRNSFTAHALPSQHSKASVAAGCTTNATGAQSTRHGKASVESSSAVLHKEQSRIQQNSRLSSSISRASASSAGTAARAHNSKKGVLTTPRTMLSLPTSPVIPSSSTVQQQPGTEADQELLLSVPTNQDISPRYFAPQFHSKATPVKRHEVTTNQQALTGNTPAKSSNTAVIGNVSSTSTEGNSMPSHKESSAGHSCSSLPRKAARSRAAAATVAGSTTLNVAWEQRVSAGGAAAANSAVSFCLSTADTRYRQAVRPAAVARTSAAVGALTGQSLDIAVRRALKRTTASMSAAPAADIVGEGRSQQAATAAPTVKPVVTAVDSRAPALEVSTVPPADNACQRIFCCHQELNPCRLDKICGAWNQGSKQSGTFTTAAVAGVAALMAQSNDTAAAVARMLRFTAAAEARVFDKGRAFKPKKQQSQQQQQQVSEQVVQELRQLLLGRLYTHVNNSQMDPPVDKQQQQQQCAETIGPKPPSQCRIQQSSSLRIDASCVGLPGTASFVYPPSDLQLESAHENGEQLQRSSQLQQPNSPQQGSEGEVLEALGCKSGMQPAGTALPDLISATDIAVLPKIRQDAVFGTAGAVAASAACAALPQWSLQDVQYSKAEDVTGVIHRSSSSTGRQSGFGEYLAAAAADATEAALRNGRVVAVKLPSLSSCNPTCEVTATTAGDAAGARSKSSSSSGGGGGRSSSGGSSSGDSSRHQTSGRHHSSKFPSLNSVEESSSHGSLAAQIGCKHSSRKSFGASGSRPSFARRQVPEIDHNDTGGMGTS